MFQQKKGGRKEGREDRREGRREGGNCWSRQTGASGVNAGFESPEVVSGTKGGMGIRMSI